MIHDQVAMSPPGLITAKWESSATTYKTRQMIQVIIFGADGLVAMVSSSVVVCAVCRSGAGTSSGRRQVTQAAMAVPRA